LNFFPPHMSRTRIDGMRNLPGGEHEVRGM
jgi:hypothetical protein